MRRFSKKAINSRWKSLKKKCLSEKELHTPTRTLAHSHTRTPPVGTIALLLLPFFFLFDLSSFLLPTLTLTDTLESGRNSAQFLLSPFPLVLKTAPSGERAFFSRTSGEQHAPAQLIELNSDLCRSFEFLNSSQLNLYSSNTKVDSSHTSFLSPNIDFSTSNTLNLHHESRPTIKPDHTQPFKYTVQHAVERFNT